VPGKGGKDNPPLERCPRVRGVGGGGYGRASRPEEDRLHSLQCRPIIAVAILIALRRIAFVSDKALGLDWLVLEALDVAESEVGDTSDAPKAVRIAFFAVQPMPLEGRVARALGQAEDCLVSVAAGGSQGPCRSVPLR